MGAPDAVAGQKFEFPHNDNQVSREYAYAWFNRVFKLGLPEPVRERPFVPVPPAQLHVFDASHPRPASERDAAGVRRAMTDLSDRQLQALAPKAGRARRDHPRRLRDGDRRSPAGARRSGAGQLQGTAGRRLRGAPGVLTRAGSPARVPAIGIVPAGWKAGPVVVWVHERGKEAAFEADGRTPSPEVKRLLAGGAAVLVPDVFLTGESGAIGSRIRVKNDDTYFGYNTGYNRSVFAERTSDVLTAIAFAKQLGGRDVAARRPRPRRRVGAGGARAGRGCGGADGGRSRRLRLRSGARDDRRGAAAGRGEVRRRARPGVARDHRPHDDLRRAAGAGGVVGAGPAARHACRPTPATGDALVDAVLPR